MKQMQKMPVWRKRKKNPNRKKTKPRRRRSRSARSKDDKVASEPVDGETADGDADQGENGSEDADSDTAGSDATDAAATDVDADEPATSQATADDEDDDSDSDGEDNDIDSTADADDDSVVSVADDDGDADVAAAKPRKRAPRKNYKIQEVIKRRQVLLIQVVKEERGNKGAALTTYLSLAGRYCVLMPNTARGGGISRKITDASDRRRLKDVIREVEVPTGMGLIVRTAGAQRTKTEIRRDYDYLLRMWESVRELTLKSAAPTLVYEEGNLIKRSIRDLYSKDIDEVVVEGEEGFREAKDFMKMLMPSHARNVKLYKDTRQLFTRHQVESQLDGLFTPNVTLPSGGYIVMNQTEALVSIDINSGKATREHNIEDTALKTNLEAAVEISRQLRLRDLAGLIVIDFIDMEENRNNRAGRTQAQGCSEERPGTHTGWSNFTFRPAGNVPAKVASRHDGKLHHAVSALRRHGRHPRCLKLRIVGIARPRGASSVTQTRKPGCTRAPGSRVLYLQ